MTVLELHNELNKIMITYRNSHSWIVKNWHNHKEITKIDIVGEKQEVVLVPLDK